MNNNISIPGFTAAIVLDPRTEESRYGGIQSRLPDVDLVALQGPRGCGFAVGLTIIGAFGNPAFLIGGLAGIASWC